MPCTLEKVTVMLEGRHSGPCLLGRGCAVSGAEHKTGSLFALLSRLQNLPSNSKAVIPKVDSMVFLGILPRMGPMSL